MEQTAQQVITVPSGIGAWPQLIAVGLQIVAIGVAAWIAYISLRAAFQADLSKVEQLARKLTVRGNVTNKGKVDWESYMDAYIDWYTSPSVLFFLGETHRKVHHDLGGTDLFNHVRKNGYEAGVGDDERKKLNSIRTCLNESIRNAANWGEGKFRSWLFRRRLPIKRDVLLDEKSRASE